MQISLLLRHQNSPSLARQQQQPLNHANLVVVREVFLCQGIGEYGEESFDVVVVNSSRS